MIQPPKKLTPDPTRSQHTHALDTQPDPDYESPASAQRRLRVGRDTIYRWLAEGRLQGHQRGGRWWVNKAAVDALLRHWRDQDAT